VFLAAVVLATTQACKRHRDSKGKPETPPAALVERIFRAQHPPEADFDPIAPTKHHPETPPVFWEAESAYEHNFPTHHPFEPANAEEAAKLSNGRWIGSGPSKVDRYLKYRISIPISGTYTLFVRKFWKHGPFRFRFDGSSDSACGPEPMLLDAVEIRKSVVANWVALGDFELKQGTHDFVVELVSRESPVAFDRFALVNGEEIPRGLGEETSAEPPPGYFVFDRRRRFEEPSLLDMRPLNETRAGQSGRLVASADGHIVSTDTKRPIRFWGVNANHEVLSLPNRLMDRYASWLASLGVNLLRLHGPFFAKGDVRTFDDEKLANLRRLHAALKNQGIYLGLSTYFPLWTNLEQDPEYAAFGGRAPFGLYFYRDQFAQLVTSHLQRVLSTRTTEGQPLAHDPALAYVELVNEDTTLFWTFSVKDLPEGERRYVEERFAAFASIRHGSLATALKHWGGAPLEGDRAEQGRLALLGLWEISKRRDARSKDTAAFLTELMRDRYTTAQAHLRSALGYRGLTVCSNFHTANARYLEPLEKWANSVCDLLDSHGYYDAPLEGPAATYMVSAGDQHDDRSALHLEPTSGLATSTPVTEPWPVFTLPVDGKPQLVSEIGWTWPNRFRAEYAVLSAGYASLHALDGLVFFASDAPGYGAGLSKFSLNDPVMMGQFPAASFAFRQGLVRAAPTVARIAVPTAKRFELEGLPIDPPEALDALRKKGGFLGNGPSAQDSGSLDPLSYWVGRVGLSFEDGASTMDSDALRRGIDRQRGQVRSATGELLFDWKKGVVRIEAPQINAIAGFFRKNETLALPHFELELDNEYASVFLVALDGQPLSTSQKLLLQIATEVTQNGYATTGTHPKRITAVGNGPILVRRIAGAVRLKRPDMRRLRVRALNAYGQPTNVLRVSSEILPLLPTTPYYLIDIADPDSSSRIPSSDGSRLDAKQH
jgi:hypothetical protein